MNATATRVARTMSDPSTCPIASISTLKYAEIVKSRSRVDCGYGGGRRNCARDYEYTGTIFGRTVRFTVRMERQSVEHEYTPAWYAYDVDTGRLVGDANDSRVLCARSIVYNVRVSRGRWCGLDWSL